MVLCPIIIHDDFSHTGMDIPTFPPEQGPAAFILDMTNVRGFHDFYARNPQAYALAKIPGLFAPGRSHTIALSTYCCSLAYSQSSSTNVRRLADPFETDQIVVLRDAVGAFFQGRPNTAPRLERYAQPDVSPGEVWWPLVCPFLPTSTHALVARRARIAEDLLHFARISGLRMGTDITHPFLPRPARRAP